MHALSIEWKFYITQVEDYVFLGSQGYSSPPNPSAASSGFNADVPSTVSILPLNKQTVVNTNGGDGFKP